MKKVLSFLFLATFALVLTGCGKSKDVLTCASIGGETEYTFKNDKVVKVKTTYTADTEEDAKSYANLFSLYGEGVTVKIDGKQVTVTMNESSLVGTTYENKTKAEIKGYVEDAGFACE